VKLFEYLADDLHKNEVDLQVYEYFKEPLFLTNEKLNHHRIPLAKVATLYPDTTLFIFGEARYFLYPLKGTVKDWVIAKLSSWQTRILITPFAKDDWDRKEKLLMDSGLVVLPADLSSLPVIDKIINKQIDTRDQKKEGVESPYRSRSLNFQEFETLKEYLVEDKLLMQWVCSTAVYPALDWNLLLALGKAIEQQRKTQADLVTYTNLLKISRISWMQDGLINESLRAAMLDYLSDDEEALARKTLQQQLQQIENTISNESLIKPQFDIHKKLNRFLLHSYNHTKPSVQDEAFIGELIRNNGLDEGQDIYLRRDNSLLRHPFDKGKKTGLAEYFKIKSGRLKSLSVGTALVSFLALFLVGVFLIKNNPGLTQWTDYKPVDQTYSISIKGSGVGQQITLHLYYEPRAQEPARESRKLENSSDTLQFKAVSITDTTSYGRLQILTADGQTIASDSFKLNSSSYQITISEVPKVPLTIYYQDASSLTLATGIAENLPSAFNVSLRQEMFKDMGVAGIQYFSESDAKLANVAAATVSDLLKTTVKPQLVNTSPEYQDVARVKIFVNQPQAAIPISKKALPKSLGEIWRGGTSNRLINIDLSKQIIYYSTGDKRTYGTYYFVESFLNENGSYRVVTRADKQYQVFFFKNVSASSFELSVCQNRYNTVQEARTIGESYCDRFNRMSLYYENDPRKIFLPVYGNNIEKSNQAKIDIINDSLTGLRNVLPVSDIEGTLFLNKDFVPVPPALQFPFTKPLRQPQGSSTPFDRNYLRYKLNANKPNITPTVTYGEFGINNHLLYLYGKPVSYEATPNRGGPYVPQYIIINSTSATSAKAIIKWLTNPAAAASAHLLIDRDGNITQFAPFNVVTYHAGASNWKGLSGLNKYAIGIELVNGGRLMKSGDKWISPADRQEIPASEVVFATHKNEKRGAAAAWQTFSQQQIDALTTICRALQTAYNIKDVLGHDDIAPVRKQDPGPAFPMQKLRADVFGSKSGK
jgi:N-acetylmuramoyl-L-alanine amidase